MNSNVILTGPPRSGTTLACYLLNKADNVIALHEPMNLKMFPDRETGLAAVRTFFGQMRSSLLERGEAISKVKDGTIPTNPFEEKERGARQSMVKRGLVRFDKSLSMDFTLILKHNGHFTFLLPELQEYFPVFILIRHPVATIASWNTIQAPVAEGNLRILQTLNPEIYAELEQIPDRLTRQVMLLDKMYQFYRKATKAIFLRYEDIIASGGKSLDSIVAAAAGLEEPLQSKNTNPVYDQSQIRDIKHRLLESAGAYLDYFPADAIESY
jgi:hypothetical protein